MLIWLCVVLYVIFLRFYWGGTKRTAEPKIVFHFKKLSNFSLVFRTFSFFFLFPCAVSNSP